VTDCLFYGIVVPFSIFMGKKGLRSDLVITQLVSCSRIRYTVLEVIEINLVWNFNELLTLLDVDHFLNLLHTFLCLYSYTSYYCKDYGVHYDLHYTLLLASTIHANPQLDVLTVTKISQKLG
jgi:hypothetical protein